jgi:hypothetical protein
MGFLKKITRVVTAPVREVARGAKKLGRAAAQAHILGTTDQGKTHLLGLPIGKDLVPVVQVAETVALTPLAGPILAPALVVGAHGGDVKDVTKSMIMTVAASGVQVASGSMPTPTSQIVTQVAGQAAIQVASGQSIERSLISSVASVPAILDPSLETKLVSSFVAASVGDAEHPLRSGLQGVGATLVQHVMTAPLSEPEEEVGTELETECETEREEKRFRHPHDVPLTTPPTPPVPCVLTASSGSSMSFASSSFPEDPVTPSQFLRGEFEVDGISLKPGGTKVAVTLSSGVRLSPDSVGMVAQDEPYRRSVHILSVDNSIFPNPLVYEKRDILSSSQDPPVVKSLVSQQTLHEMKTECYAHRVVESHYVSNLTGSGLPVTTTELSNQHHLNVNCPKAAAEITVTAAAAYGLAPVVVLLPAVTP